MSNATHGRRISEQLRAEEERVKRAYAARQQLDERYAFFNPANLLRIQQCEREIGGLLRRRQIHRLESLHFLDVGCGVGFWIRQFISWGARPENVSGVDLLPGRIAVAKELCPNSVRIEVGNAAQLSHQDSTFDVVSQFAVFSSVLDDAVRQAIAGEMLRVLRPDGFILWYDFHVNNPRNPDVRGVTKRQIFELFPNCAIELRRTTLLPPLARRVALHLPVLHYVFSGMKLPCTHYLGVISKR